MRDAKMKLIKILCPYFKIEKARKFDRVFITSSGEILYFNGSRIFYFISSD